jgi:multidrug transporter EmrE-like cation transporter
VELGTSGGFYDIQFSFAPTDFANFNNFVRQIFFMTSEIALKFIFFGLIALAIAFEVVGDILFKKWSTDSKHILLYVGLLIYFIGTIFWAISLKYEYLSKAISVFTVLNLIIVVLVGVLYFKEDLSLINKVGIGLGILGVILTEI